LLTAAIKKAKQHSDHPTVFNLSRKSASSNIQKNHAVNKLLRSILFKSLLISSVFSHTPNVEHNITTKYSDTIAGKYSNKAKRGSIF